MMRETEKAFAQQKNEKQRSLLIFLVDLSPLIIKSIQSYLKISKEIYKYRYK